MLNKLLTFIREQKLLQPGDCVTCAVSGGADSMALLWGMYLLQEKLQIRLSAAHFNHHLRGAESDRDEAFVRAFCQRYEIPFFCGTADISVGKKGLEAAARDARYGFLRSLPGKIATAHTANDNAETVLMHLIRGTGLKGLGAIAPVNGPLIRPMLSVTRQEVLAFLQEYHIAFVEDSSNATDQFLRNRIRHHVMPLLEQENPKIAENLSAMALDLREDEKTLAALSGELPDISALQNMDSARRNRMLSAFLQRSGVREPERNHIALAEKLVFSQNPSAKASFPNGIMIGRVYDRLEPVTQTEPLDQLQLTCPGITEIPQLGLRVICTAATEKIDQADCFTVCSKGTITLRCRQSGDDMRLQSGTKSLKKLFIDRKIPASRRMQIPVIADDLGVLGVYGIGANLDRLGVGVQIRFEPVLCSDLL